ncbi:MAG: dihydroorotate dehydrogenase electron transfer subunit [Candidatus Glassbacteria bacterium]
MDGFRLAEVPISRLDWISGNTLLIGAKAAEISGHVYPGQFFMLRGGIEFSPLWSRPFSICDVNDMELLFMVRVSGRGSQCLASKKIGDTLSIVGPLGNRVMLGEPGSSYMLIAGGIGLAPFPFLARWIRNKQPGAEIALVYGEKTGSMVVDLRGLFEADVNTIVCTDDGSTGQKGTVVDACTRLLKRKSYSMIFACGPKPMLKAIQSHPKCRESDLMFFMEELMACGFGTCMGCVTALRDGDQTYYARVCREGPVFDGRKVII